MAQNEAIQGRRRERLGWQLYCLGAHQKCLPFTNRLCTLSSYASFASYSRTPMQTSEDPILWTLT
eukprot:2711573-Rhodomonas_salina.1